MEGYVEGYLEMEDESRSIDATKSPVHSSNLRELSKFELIRKKFLLWWFVFHFDLSRFPRSSPGWILHLIIILLTVRIFCPLTCTINRT